MESCVPAGLHYPLELAAPPIMAASAACAFRSLRSAGKQRSQHNLCAIGRTLTLCAHADLPKYHPQLVTHVAGGRHGSPARIRCTTAETSFLTNAGAVALASSVRTHAAIADTSERSARTNAAEDAADTDVGSAQLAGAAGRLAGAVLGWTAGVAGPMRPRCSL